MELKNSRRSVLKFGFAATAGAALGLPSLQVLAAQKKIMPEGLSIYTMAGKVMINGVAANPKTVIDTNAVIETGKNGYVVFVLGDDAHFVREKTVVNFGESTQLKHGVELVKGMLLSSFAPRKGDEQKMVVKTSAATVFISSKKAALFTESKAKSSYICLCYGKAKFSVNADPDSLTRIKSLQHDKPKKVFLKAKKGKFHKRAKLKNHDDQQVTLLDSLNGRISEFNKLKGGLNTSPKNSQATHVLGNTGRN